MPSHQQTEWQLVLYSRRGAECAEIGSVQNTDKAGKAKRHKFFWHEYYKNGFPIYCFRL